MPDRNSKQQTSIDELLAAYTDQVIESQSPTEIPLAEDPEIKALQETILSLRNEMPAKASQKSSRKIQQNVRQYWEEKYPPKQSVAEKIKHLLASPQKSYQSPSRRRQKTAMRLAAAAMLVLIAAFILLPSTDLSGGATSGAAAGEISPWVLVGGLLLIGGVGLWWWLGSRRK